MHMATLAFLALIALFALVGILLLGRAHSPLAAPAAILFVPGFLLQQYVRALAFTRGRPMTALVQTFAVMVLAAAFLVLDHLQGVFTAQRILLSLGAAYGAVGVIGAATALKGQARGLGLRALLGFHRYVKQSGWVFLGVSSTELLSRVYAFVVAGWFGATALASLSATQQMLRPTSLLAAAWSMAARPDLAQRRDAGDRSGFVRVLLLAAAFGVASSVAWTLLIFWSWPLISRDLFAGKYAANGWMVLLWGLAAGLSFGQVVASSGLQTLKVFKLLALANTAAGLAAVAGILLMMAAIGYPGAIIGTAVGQGVELLVMTVLLAVLLRRGASRGQAAPALSRAT
jgi:O-antigen/teichoic acid export membrane protein